MRMLLALAKSMTAAVTALLFVAAMVAVTVRAQAVPVVTAVSGCGTQQGAAAVDCYPASIITISGAALPGSNAFATVGGVLCNIISFVSASQLVCSVANDESPLPLDTLLPVVVASRSTLVSSSPVFLLSFAPFPQPTLQSVSGCSDAGLSTYGCNTSTAVLTVRGSGFALGNDSLQKWTLIFTTAQYALASPLLQSTFVDSSTMILPFSNFFEGSYSRLPNTGNLTFALGHANRVTNTTLTVGFIPTPANSATPPNQPASTIIVTGVSGCAVNDGNVTLGCYRPSILTIAGSGFPTAGVLITVGPEQCTTVWSVRYSLIACELHDDWGNTPTETLLPVVVADLFHGVQSAPFYGVLLAPLQVPVITSVSGCVGSGLATYSCMPGVDTITLTGSGFVNDPKSWSLIAPGISIALYDGSIQDGGNITIALAASVTAIVGSSLGSNLTAYLQHGSFYSNFITLSFAKPTVNISLIFSPSCSSLSPLAVVGCAAGVSVLYITGLDWYSSPQISVGGFQCRAQLSDNSIAITLPVVVGLTPGFGYDLVVTFPDGSSFTLPAAVAFSAAPAISSITSQFCPRDYLGSNVLNCEAGSILTILGASLNASSGLTVLLRNGYLGYTLLCGDVQVLSSSTLLCQLPALNASVSGAAGQQLSVQMYVNATVYSNAVALVPYRSAATPAVYNVTGCSGFDPSSRGVVGCYTGSVITISGLLAGFSTSAPRVSLYDTETGVLYDCALAGLTAQSTVTCILPYIPHSTDEELVLPIQVTMGKASNWLLAVGYSSLLYASPLPASCPSCSQVSLIICAVLLAVVTVVLVAVLCLQLRARSAKQPLSHSLGSEHSEPSKIGRDVELMRGTQ